MEQTIIVIEGIRMQITIAVNSERSHIFPPFMLDANVIVVDKDEI